MSYEEDEVSAIEDLRWLVEDMFRALAWPRELDVNTQSIPRKHILVTVKVDEPEEILGHILGKRYSNIRSVVQMIRSQQLLPHDRYIRVQFTNREGEEIITFINTDVSAVRQRNDYSFDTHQLRVDENGNFITPEEKFKKEAKRV